jgi:hypothetical protein
MKVKLFTGAVAVLVAGFAVAADLKSSLQPGDKIPGPFYPLNVNGPTPGEKKCLVCRNGDNPVIMIFARNADNPTLNKLVKQVDEATGKNADCKMGSFVVYLTDDDKTEAKLAEIAKKEKLQNTVLSLDNPAGPKGYEVNKDADVTVVLYTDRVVKANHAFKAGELKDADVEKIMKDVEKIKPAK